MLYLVIFFSAALFFDITHAADDAVTITSSGGSRTSQRGEASRQEAEGHMEADHADDGKKVRTDEVHVTNPDGTSMEVQSSDQTYPSKEGYGEGYVKTYDADGNLVEEFWAGGAMPPRVEPSGEPAVPTPTAEPSPDKKKRAPPKANTMRGRIFINYNGSITGQVDCTDYIEHESINGEIALDYRADLALSKGYSGPAKSWRGYKFTGGSISSRVSCMTDEKSPYSRFTSKWYAMGPVALNPAKAFGVWILLDYEKGYYMLLVYGPGVPMIVKTERIYYRTRSDETPRAPEYETTDDSVFCSFAYRGRLQPGAKTITGSWSLTTQEAARNYEKTAMDFSEVHGGIQNCINLSSELKNSNAALMKIFREDISKLYRVFDGHNGVIFDPPDLFAGPVVQKAMRSITMPESYGYLSGSTTITADWTFEL